MAEMQPPGEFSKEWNALSKEDWGPFYYHLIYQILF